MKKIICFTLSLFMLISSLPYSLFELDVFANTDVLPIRGDFTMDSSVNVDDALYLLRHLLLGNRYPLNQDGDLNGDSVTDVDDSLFLLRHILLPDDYPLLCKNHNIVDAAAVEPTCTQTGLTAGRHCSLCSYVEVKQTEVAAKGHNSTVIKAEAAKCVVDGYVREYCSECGLEYETTTMAVGHLFAAPVTVTEASCVNEGLIKTVCKICGEEHEESVEAYGHNYVYHSTENSVDSFKCELCGDIISEEMLSKHETEEMFVDNCEKDYHFVVIFQGTEEELRDKITITNDNAIDPADKEKAFTIISLEGNRWQIAPADEYEAGGRYIIELSGDVSFEDYEARKLILHIKAPAKEEYELRDDIIFIVLPDKSSLEYAEYTLVTSQGSGLVYFTYPTDSPLTEEHIGKIVCIGNCSTVEELISRQDAEYTLGKLESVFVNPQGKSVLVLSEPTLEEVFELLDVYARQDIEFHEEDFTEDVETTAKTALMESKGFNEFLASVVVSTNSYADSRGLIPQGLNDYSFLKNIKLSVKANVSDLKKLSLEISGSIQIPLKNKNNVKLATLTISFKTNMEASYTFEASLSIFKRGIEFAIVQDSATSFEFGIKIDSTLNKNDTNQSKSIYKTKLGKYHVEGCTKILGTSKDKLTKVSTSKMDELYRKYNGNIPNVCSACNPVKVFLAQNYYAYNSISGQVHCFDCTTEDRVKASSCKLFTDLPTDPEYVECSVCSPSTKDERDYESIMLESLKYQDWGEVLSDLKKATAGDNSSNVSKEEKKLVGASFGIGIISVGADINLVLEFSFSGSLNYKCETKDRHRYGIRVGFSSPGVFHERNVLKKSSDFTAMCKANFKVGLEAEIYIGALGKLVKGGIGAQIGVYADVYGIFHAQKTETGEGDGQTVEKDSYYAAYLECGLYIELNVSYNIFGYENSYVIYGGSDGKFPFVEVGYKQVYYNYEDVVEECTVSGKRIDLDNYSILKAKRFDLVYMVSVTEQLSFKGDPSKYKVTTKLLDDQGNASAYCTVDDGIITVKDGAPCQFTVKAVISVEGTTPSVRTLADFFSPYYRTGGAKVDLEDYTFDLTITNHVISEWETIIEPTCTEKGMDKKECVFGCGTNETRELKALGHNTVVDVAISPTCVTDGRTRGSHCDRCDEVFVTCRVLKALGHQYTDPYTCHDRPCQRTGCDHVEVATTLHRFGDWVEIETSGCADISYKARACVDCHYTESDIGGNIIEYIIHDYVYKEEKRNTCDEEGLLVFECTRCGHFFETIIPSSGHIYNGYVIDGDYHYQKCDVYSCGIIINKEIHNFENDCDPDCSVCGYTRDIVHQWSESSNDSEHWIECTVCKKIKNKGEHVGGTATCTEARICTVCNNYYGEAKGHNEEELYSADEKNHWFECIDCGAKCNEKAHSVTPATCTENGYCNVCGYMIEAAKGHIYKNNPKHQATPATCTKKATYYRYCDCGEISAETFEHGNPLGHSYENLHNDMEHWQECKTCYDIKDKAIHDFDNACDEKCNNCSYTRTTKHLWGDYDHNHKEHWQICIECDEPSKTTAHTGNATCASSGVCDVCKAEYGPLPHTKASVYIHDDNTHWYVCTKCGAKCDEENHKGIAATCTKDGVCKCGYITEPAKGHSYTKDDPKYQAIPATCTEKATYYYYCACGEKSTKTFEYGNPLGHSYENLHNDMEHWKECKTCHDIKDKAIHDFDNACDEKCNNCSYTRTTKHLWGDYDHNHKEHWQICIECDEPSKTTAHTGNATCASTGVCDVCGAEYGPLTHNKASVYSHDENTHWYACTDCGARFNEEKHSGTVATCTKDGVCKCGYVTEPAKGHSYTEDEPKHQANPATCTEKATYYYYCACGEKDTRTFEYGNTLGHKPGGEYFYNDTEHWRFCTVCDDVAVSTVHDFDNACDETCNTCAYTRTTEHNLGDYQVNDTHHWKVCKVCRERVEQSAHQGTEKTCTQKAYCFICEQYYGDTADHIFESKLNALECLKSEATCTEPAVYYYACTECNQPSDKDTYTYGEPLDHLWFANYVPVKGGHAKKCERSGCNAYSATEPHTGGNATCTQEAVCTVCGASYGEKEEHVYTDMEADTEYLRIEATCTKAATYYYSCVNCGRKGSTYFDYGEPLDHAWDKEWTSDENTHYHKCTREGCNEITDYGLHRFKYTVIVPTSCAKPGTELCECEICSYSCNRDIPMTEHLMIAYTYETTGPIYKDDMEVYIQNIYCICANCGGNPIFYGQMEEHGIAPYKVVLPVFATCTEGGLKGGLMYTDGSGRFKVPQVPTPPLGHDYDDDGVCTRCGYTLPSPSEGLKYTLSADGTYYTVTGIGDCTDTDIVIPATYKGLPVTAIGDFAFDGCSSLTSIDIPESVTSIGRGAFSGCSSLISIDIPDGVTSISDFTFGWCYSLTSVTIPMGATSIGEGAFYACESLTSINIPTGVTSIGVNAFWGCSSLTSVNIPDGITSIGVGTFFGCSSLTSINIPKWVTSIGHDAFNGCSSLTSITIPEGVTSISDLTFANCSSLTIIDIPKGITSIGNYAFFDCSGLTSIDIPEVVTSIGDFVFTNCSSLKSISIPGGVTSIGNYAFNNCSSLTSITIPESVTSVGNYAFYFCNALTTVYFTGTEEQWAAITIGSYNAPLENAEIVFNYKEASQGLWYTLSTDGTYYTVAVIGDCTDTDIVIPATHEGLPVKAIGPNAFNSRSDITSISIPNTVTIIGDAAFSHCSSLKSINISEGVTSIGDYAFYECSSLTSIDIPDSVTSVGSYAFFRCSSLENVNMSANVKSIGGCAFYCCDSLTSIDIPEGVTTIEFSTFSGCSSLTSIDIPDSVTSIGNYAFDGCDSLRSVDMSVNLKTIGNNVFYGCSSLTRVDIPEGVTSIGDNVFSGCTNIKSISLPSTITSIGDFAFYECCSLTSITIPEGVTSIGDWAFAYCSSLSNIVISKSVTSIGYCVDISCDHLATVYYRGTEAQWEAISNDSSNTKLLYDVKIVYNYKG